VESRDVPTRMDWAAILLSARGYRLSVASRIPLNDRQRAWIRAHKWELLQLLADLVPPAGALTGDDREATKVRTAVRAGAQATGASAAHAPSAMCVYRYRLSDRPETWLTMIAPNCDLDEARRCLRLRFGERLTDVVEHHHRPCPR
jgi:hypothetical protein